MVKTLLFGLILAANTTSLYAEERATDQGQFFATAPQPIWSELTLEQKIILSPLADEWDSLPFHRQKKWLIIAERFNTLPLDQQRRIQSQMHAWGKLTPEEQESARQNYSKRKRLSAKQRAELKRKWEEYSKLPEEEKARYKRLGDRMLHPEKYINEETSTPQKKTPQKTDSRRLTDYLP